MYKNRNITFYGSNTIGEKGQVVIPVEGRQALDMNPGDKLIFVGDLDMGILIVAKAEIVEEHISNMQTNFESMRSHLKKKS